MSKQYTLSDLEKITAISRDILRSWEQRYDFPRTIKLVVSKKFYDRATLEKLILIKRLIAQGHRIGAIVSLSIGDLQRLIEMLPKGDDRRKQELFLIETLKNRPNALGGALEKMKDLYGMREVVVSVIPNVMREIGELWEIGQLKVYQEHLFTEAVVSFLRQELKHLPKEPKSQNILVATLTGEEHTIGALLFSYIIKAEGMNPIFLGTSISSDQVVEAQRSIDAQIVAISVCVNVDTAIFLKMIERLRESLPKSVQIWVGGAGASKLEYQPHIDSIEFFETIFDLLHIFKRDAV